MALPPLLEKVLPDFVTRKYLANLLRKSPGPTPGDIGSSSRSTGETLSRLYKAAPMLPLAFNLVGDGNFTIPKIFAQPVDKVY